MKITKDTIATVELKVANKLGQLIEKTDEPMALLIGGYGNTLPAIESASWQLMRGATAGCASRCSSMRRPAPRGRAPAC